ncbi:hypothetical protein SD71_13725 [Cohnella kolymensis]|uniref:SLH domain-containing protein n=1 Tax=Cohnella kolymensis TaxID=1590652 RepID=A0ABR5A307_9BACL|nr:S-layer homology domain-containing protein [Cohnella kolymensis]KIL35376.1 hypothetical protein SD71_13725 [Cohnella kolymensis]
MIARALKATKKLQDVSNTDSIISTFSDAKDIHASLRLGVAFATSKGLVIGNAGKFNPKSNASRAEAAVILYRLFNYK